MPTTPGTTGTEAPRADLMKSWLNTIEAQVKAEREVVRLTELLRQADLRAAGLRVKLADLENECEELAQRMDADYG